MPNFQEAMHVISRPKAEKSLKPNVKMLLFRDFSPSATARNDMIALQDFLASFLGALSNT
jgi:hypothetical protein